MSDDSIKNFVDGQIAIFKTIEAIGKSDLLKKEFVITKCDVDSYGKILAYLAQNESTATYLHYFENQTLQSELIKTLEKKIPQAQYLLNDYYSLKGLMKIKDNLNDYQVISQSLTDRLFKFQTTAIEVESLLQSLLILFIYNDKNVTDRLKQFVSTGRIFFYLDESIRNGKLQETALCIVVALLDYKPKITIDFSQTPHRDKANSGWQKFQRIFEQVFYSDDDLWHHLLDIMGKTHIIYSRLFETLSQHDSNEVGVKIFYDIIKKLFSEDKEDAIRRLSSFILEYNNFIRESLKNNGAVFDDYVKESVNIQSLEKMIQNVEYDYDNLNHRSFAERICTLKLGDNNFANWAFRSLSALDKDDWVKLIKESGYTSTIVEHVSNQFSMKFGIALREALEELSEELIDSEQEPSFSINSISRYIKGLDTGTLIMFKRNIRDKLIDNVDKNLIWFMKYLDNILKDCSIWQDNLDSFYRKFLISEIEHAVPQEINWCIELITVCGLNSARKKVVRTIKKDIKDKIRNKLNEAELESSVKESLDKLQILF